MPSLSELPLRRAAVERAVAPLRGKPFAWDTRGNCIYLLRALLVEFGHVVPKVPQFRSALGAKRALTKAGYESLEALADEFAQPIAPARMIVGDYVLLPGEPFGALGIYAGGSKVLCWHEKAPALCALNVTSDEIMKAWRVEYLGPVPEIVDPWGAG